MHLLQKGAHRRPFGRDAAMGKTPNSGLFFSSLVTQQTKLETLATEKRGRIRRRPVDKDFDRRAEREAYRLPPLLDAERVFRHGGWERDRERVFQALVSTNASESRRERFQTCGCDCVIEYSPDLKKHRVRASYCGDRFCVPCCKARSLRIQANLLAWCKGQRVRFVTLTLRPESESLSACLDHLIRSFTRLRAQKLWSDNVTAGAYTVEMTRGRAGTHWHVHLHALVIGSYIRQSELSEGWRQASGGSVIVDVREVKDHDRGVYYVAKYAAKGFGSDVTQNPDWLAECVCALRGRRLLGSFGQWRGKRVEVHADAASDWKPVGRFTEIHAAALRGEEWARGVFKSLNVACGVFGEQPIFIGPEG
jgi:hypothetical protein